MMSEQIRYAQDAPYWSTTVPVERSRDAITKLLDKWGCEEYGWMRRDGADTLVFTVSGQRFRVNAKLLPWKPNYKRAWNESAVAAEARMLAKAQQQAWRALYFHLKATLEMAWWEGVESVLLRYLVLPGGQTLGEVPLEALTHNALPKPQDDSDAVEGEVVDAG